MTDHIQVGDVAPRVQYVANGSQTAFTFRFPIFTASDLEAWIDGVQQPAAAYSISGVGISGGGTVLFAVPPATGAVVTLRRRLAISRTTDYQDDGIIRAKVLNDEFDYQTAALQQVADDAGRAVKRSFLSTDAADLTLPEPQPGRSIKWNAAATGLENSTTDVDQVAATAQTLTTQAQASATLAATSASAAAGSQAAAATAASAAQSSAAAAQGSANAAQASEVSAFGSATAAGTAATAATSSATAAAISAANAHTSETNAAAGAAATAASAATNASASAGTAQSAAGSAQTYAGLAQAAASGGAVKVSATDTTGNFLQNKLLAGTNIALTKGNGGGNETLTVAVTGLGSAAALPVDTDTTLAANSDARLASQKAVADYVTAQLGPVQQDVVQNYLLDAITGAWAAGSYANGGFDAFNADTLGVYSTGQSYDAANKLYSNPLGYAQYTPTGAAFGTLTGYGGLTAAFDGVTAQIYPASAGAAVVTSGYIGKSLGATKTVGKVVVYGPSATYGVITSASGGSVAVYGKTGAAPANATDGSMLASQSVTNAAGQVISLTFTPISLDHVWVVGTNNTGDEDVFVAELQVFTATAPAAMTLVSGALSPTPASAPAQVKLTVLWKDLSGGAVLNTDLTAEASRDGVTWSAGALSDSGLIVTGFKVLWATADVSGQPAGTTVKYRLKAVSGKSQQIKAVALMTR